METSQFEPLLCVGPGLDGFTESFISRAVAQYRRQNNGADRHTELCIARDLVYSDALSGRLRGLRIQLAFRRGATDGHCDVFLVGVSSAGPARGGAMTELHGQLRDYVSAHDYTRTVSVVDDCLRQIGSARRAADAAVVARFPAVPGMRTLAVMEMDCGSMTPHDMRWSYAEFFGMQSLVTLVAIKVHLEGPACGVWAVRWARLPGTEAIVVADALVCGVQSEGQPSGILDATRAAFEDDIGDGALPPVPPGVWRMSAPLAPLLSDTPFVPPALMAVPGGQLLHGALTGVGGLPLPCNDLSLDIGQILCMAALAVDAAGDS